MADKLSTHAVSYEPLTTSFEQGYTCCLFSLASNMQIHQLSPNPIHSIYLNNPVQTVINSKHCLAISSSSLVGITSTFILASPLFISRMLLARVVFFSSS